MNIFEILKPLMILLTLNNGVFGEENPSKTLPKEIKKL